MGRSMSNDAYQAIVDLGHIGQAVSRWTTVLAQRGELRDPESEYDHIRANLDEVGRLLEVGGLR